MASPTPGNSSKIEEHQTGVQQKQNPEASVSTPALIGPENSAGSLPRNTSPPQGKRYETKAEYEAKREIRILEKYKTTEENYASASLKAKNTALKPDPYDADEAEFSYEMSRKHRGVFVIFNEKNFSIPDMGDRPGTDVDAARLTTQFSRLGFEVRLFNNKTCSTMLHIMEEGNCPFLQVNLTLNAQYIRSLKQ